MTVQIGIERSAGVVGKYRLDEIARLFRFAIGIAAVVARFGVVFFDIGKCCFDRLFVCFDQSGVAGDERHDRDRFRCGESEIEAKSSVLGVADLFAVGKDAVQ